MSIVLALDNKSAKQLENLAPHKSMYDLNHLWSLTNNARIPKPVASTFSAWLHDPTQQQDQEQNKMNFMESISVH